jgi:hypothetical protein
VHKKLVVLVLTTSFKGMTSGVYGMVKASLACKPVGAAIGLLALAVGVVVGAFKFMTASLIVQKLVHKIVK